MGLFPTWRRPAVPMRHSVFVNCQGGHRTVLPAYRTLAGSVARALEDAGWTVAQIAEHPGHGEIVFLHRATGPSGGTVEYAYTAMSDRTVPFGGTTVDVHLVVAAVHAAAGCSAVDWSTARAALDAGVRATRAAGHEVSAPA